MKKMEDKTGTCQSCKTKDQDLKFMYSLNKYVCEVCILWYASGKRGKKPNKRKAKSNINITKPT